MKALFITLFLTLGCFLFSTALWADIEERGWSGSIGLVLGGVSSENPLDAYGGEKRIESLDSIPARYDYPFLLPEFEVGYTFQNDVKAYLDSSLLEGGETGISYTFGGGTTLLVSLPLFLGTRSDVWQDPYLTGRDRQMTEATLEEAIGFSLENIGGLYASIEYLYQDISIKNDRAGESSSGRLTAAEIKQLQRSNRLHHVAATLPPFMLSRHLYLIGGASYTRSSADGAANSFTAKNIELTLAYEAGRFEAFGHLSAGTAQYRVFNPLFNRERKDQLSTIALGITYWEPFNWQQSSLELVVASEQSDSNIKFYETQVELLTVGIHYHF